MVHVSRSSRNEEARQALSNRVDNGTVVSFFLSSLEDGSTLNSTLTAGMRAVSVTIFLRFEVDISRETVYLENRRERENICKMGIQGDFEMLIFN